MMSIIYPISVFSMQEADGFYRQVMDVENGVSDHQLGVVHTARYIVIKPFLFIESVTFGNVVNSFLISLFTVFLFFKQWKFSGEISPLIFILLFFPFFVSMRTSLSFLSMFILYLSLVRVVKFRFLFFFGGFVSILSSGTVLNYLAGLIYFLFFFNQVKINKYYVLPIFLIVVLAIYPSLLNKLDFFGGGMAGVYNMISRSNFFDALIYGKHLNLTVYALFTVVFLLFSKFFNKAEKFLLYLCLFSLYLFEGLGSLALIPVMIYILLCKIKLYKRRVSYFN